MQSALLVFIGGGLGSLLRYGFSVWLPVIDIPRGTLVANAISCLILGFVLGIYGKELIADHHKMLLATGFCGGFSTFSTFSAEIVQLYQEGSPQLALLYGAGSMIVGILGIALGLLLARVF